MIFLNSECQRFQFSSLKWDIYEILSRLTHHSNKLFVILQKLGKEEIFKRKFQGVFSDQKICKDCPHRYEREEVFFALNVTVKNATLQDSLAQYVKGELLEGDNAYYCEKCGEKVSTLPSEIYTKVTMKISSDAHIP